MKQGLSIVALVVAIVGFSLCATGQDAPKNRPGGTTVNTKSITATVESIDYKTRTVTLKGPEGNMVTLKVGEEAKNFNKVHKGDKVTFDYYESMAVDVRKATGAPKATEERSITRAKPGQQPGGRIETTTSITARVENVDYESRTITFRMPDGNTKNFRVGDQVKRLKEIVPGDEVYVKYTEAVAISVKKP